MVKARPVTAGAVALALTLTGCSEGAKATPKIVTTVRPGVAPVPPQQGAYFGAWVESGGAPAKPSASPGTARTASPSPTPTGNPVTAVTRFESGLGRQLDIVQIFRTWKQDFPLPSDTALITGSRFLMLAWAGNDTRKIASGSEDGVIRERARAIKALGKPIFLRWQRDMEKVSLRDKKIHSPADYIAAWKHIRAVFKEEKVENVAWVWSPTAKGFSADAPSFYPGDDQVDWIGADVYPSGNIEYRDFVVAAKDFMKWAGGKAKPIMISEFGVPRAYAARRAEWLRNSARYLQSPQVKAVVYYDSDVDGLDPQDPRKQYSVSGDAQALSALRELATTPYFNPRGLPVTSN